MPIAASLERPFPTDFESEFHALEPGQGLGYEADAVLVNLMLHGFIVARGLYREQVIQSAWIASDPEAREYYPDEAELFKGVENQAAWLAADGGRAAIGIYYKRHRWDDYSLSLDLSELPQITVDRVIQAGNGWGSIGPDLRSTGEVGVTMACRTGELGRNRADKNRLYPDENFSLEYSLGVLTLANLTNYHGVSADCISATNWASQQRALELFARLGFCEIEKVSSTLVVRPTLQPAGTVINGHVVVERRDIYGVPLPGRVVYDERVTQMR
jgi:hypothetical protein